MRTNQDHKPRTTVDLYGDLFSDQLDEVAERLDAAARAVSDVPLRLEGKVVGLESRPARRCCYVFDPDGCSPDGIRTRATALRVPSHSD